MVSNWRCEDAQLEDVASLCARVGIRTCDGEGRTLYAEEHIDAGQCILRECPMLVTSSKQELKLRTADAVRTNPAVLAPLVCVSPEDDIQLLAEGIVDKFSFEFLDGANVALFRLISVINHACATSAEANCCLSVPFDAGSVAEDEEVALVAVRSIKVGEPLRMPYVCPFAPHGQLEDLQRAHQFICRCSSCVAGPPQAIIPACANCATQGPSLRRCGGCRAVFYCGTDCQQKHRPEHKNICKQTQGLGAPSRSSQDNIILSKAQQQFDAVMDTSDSAMSSASDALSRRRRFVAEEELDASLGSVRSFLEFYDGTLFAHHSFMYYARGNFVKQALTRLAMRLRLRGKEPAGPGGCGALALEAKKQLAGCLATTNASLPRFQIEVLSLLRDARDLGYLAASLGGLAADLDMCGRPDEGRIVEEGLEEVGSWATETLNSCRDVLHTYGEDVCTDAGFWAAA